MIAIHAEDALAQNAQVFFWGFDDFPITPLPQPGFRVVRQEYDLEKNELHIMNCGRFDHPLQAEGFLFEIVNANRDIGWQTQVLSIHPRVMHVFDPVSEQSFYIGVDSLNRQYSLQ